MINLPLSYWNIIIILLITHSLFLITLSQAPLYTTDSPHLHGDANQIEQLRERTKDHEANFKMRLKDFSLNNCNQVSRNSLMILHTLKCHTAQLAFLLSKIPRLSSFLTQISRPISLFYSFLIPFSKEVFPCANKLKGK